jgi:hypothetical protein
MKKQVISVFLILVIVLSFSANAFADSAKYKSTLAYIELLEEYEIEYTIQEGRLDDEIINFVDEGEYRDVIDIDASFMDTEDEVTFYSFDVIKFDTSDRTRVLEAVNDLNSKISYGFFFVTVDGVNACWDVILGEKDAKGILEIALPQFYFSVDEGYSELAKFEK